MVSFPTKPDSQIIGCERPECNRFDRPTEGFYDTAVAMPFKLELREILPTDVGLNKRQRCAEGLA